MRVVDDAFLEDAVGSPHEKWGEVVKFAGAIPLTAVGKVDKVAIHGKYA